MAFPSKLARLISAAPAPKLCKVCAASTLAKVGSVDFHRYTPFSPAAIPIEYWQCDACGFAWAPAFDSWDDSLFRRFIYNRDIIRIETPQNSLERSTNLTAMLRVWLADFPVQTRILDYGCGPGLLVDRLNQLGFVASGYDHFHPPFTKQPEGKFDVITCFEVLEHIKDIESTVDHMLSFLKPSGLVIISTYLAARPMDINWWYCAPRSGHISFWTFPALHAVFSKRQLIVASDGNAFSFAFPETARATAMEMLKKVPT